MFDAYIALGDSMSIDFYPAQDAQKLGLTSRDDIGSASLFFRNETELFPDFAAADLSSMFPGVEYRNLEVDGATTYDALHENTSKVLSEYAQKRCLATLTIGGNDLLSAFRRHGKNQEALAAELNEVRTRNKECIRLIESRMNSITLIVTTPPCLS